jgi:hypothetical protein
MSKYPLDHARRVFPGQTQRRTVKKSQEKAASITLYRPQFSTEGNKLNSYIGIS